MNEAAIIRYANYEDLKKIAKIHKENYPEGHFLNELSLYLVASYYGSFLKYPLIFLVCVRSGKICGFVLGGEAHVLNEAKNDFIRESKYRLGLYVTRRLFSIKFVRKFLPRFLNLIENRLFRQLNQKDFSKPKVSPYRLLSITVANKMKGKNVGKILLDNFEDELGKMGVKKYTLSVKQSNLRAVKFYHKNGFCIQKQTDTGIYMYKILSL